LIETSSDGITGLNHESFMPLSAEEQLDLKSSLSLKEDIWLMNLIRSSIEDSKSLQYSEAIFEVEFKSGSDAT